MTQNKIFYRRNLPHWQPRNRPIFSTFRLAGSLPAEAISLLKARANLDQLQSNAQNATSTLNQPDSMKQTWFRITETWLDDPKTGPTWLKNPQVAKLVGEVLHHLDARDYHLDCFTIMPNHVHMVFTLLPGGPDMAAIMHRIKGFTASKANSLLGRKGPFWQGESFDHVVRSQSALLKTVRYILENPVKAGLVTRWQDWPFSYVNDALKAAIKL